MKEELLVKLGFEKIDVGTEESGDETFFYYIKDFGEKNVLSLISPPSDSVKDGEWYVEVFEDDSVRIDNEDDLEAFIDVVYRIIYK